MSLKEITNTAPLWWELQNIPTEVVKELRRRNNTNNIGMKIPSPFINATFNFDKIYQGDEYGYKGPMTPWVRVFSNSTGKATNTLVPRSSYLDRFYVPVDYDGFILKGGDGFYDAFGYDSKIGFNQTNAIIGYEADGKKPHYIDGLYRTQTGYSTRNDPSFPQNNQTPSVIPPPGVTQITVKQSKEFLTYATVSFKCFGLAQLEYLTPFFLTPGINIFIEFGWNLFNQQSLLNLAEPKDCWELIEKPQTGLDRANKSNGNYGCVSGIINKHTFNTTDGFVYECTMDIVSRQAMFAGMRTDTNAKINVPSPKPDADSSSIEFLDLRTFIKLYLPKINEVLKENQSIDQNQNNSKANFLNYIVDSINNIKNTKDQNDTEANQQQLEKNSQTAVKQLIKNIAPNSNSNLFYNGKPEDRVFMGRLDSVYNEKSSISPGPVISYGTVTPSPVNTPSSKKVNPRTDFEQFSEIDTVTDFDGKEGATEVWMQLDFVFELVNLFMSNTKTKQYLIDISDIIISAHPNLISCDKDVLIPNPVSPKINKGTIYKKGSQTSGYVKSKDIAETEDIESDSYWSGVGQLAKEALTDTTKIKNPFLSQLQDITIPRNKELETKFRQAKTNGKVREFFNNLTVEESFYFACEAARKTFKTAGRIRDNLDILINYFYYKSINKNRSAAFPFSQDELITRNVNNKNIEIKYKKYYYGYLKHLYISKRKLIEIVKSEETKNYKQFIVAILNSLNTATENFWKFDVVEGVDKSGNSILSIVDKNTVNLDALKQIYTFELGSTNNVLKSIDFNVSLSPEQSVNILFGAQNSAAVGLKDKYTNDILRAQNKLELEATLTDLSKVPFLKFVDRMDRYQLGLLAKQQEREIQTTTQPVSSIPGTSSGIENDNSMIETLQKYGPQDTNNVLCMSVIQVSPAYKDAVKKITNITGTGRGDAAARMPSINQLKNAPKNYKFLCLPPELRGKLLQMIDDGDYRHNSAKYSGIADNFSITLKLDGIFSFRNLQVFAINNLPKPYVPGNAIFQILEVEHVITAGKWETVVSALVRSVGACELEYITI